MNISPYVPQPNSGNPEMLLQDFIDEVFWPAKEDLRVSTKRGYKRDFARILPALGHLPLCEVRHLAIQHLIGQCSTAKMADNARMTLSSVLAFACELEILKQNHARSTNFIYPDVIPGPKAHDQGVVLTNFDDILSFLAMLKRTVPGSPLERASLLGFGAGLRKGEIFGVDKELIDFERSLVNIVRTFVAGENGYELLPPKTESSVRAAPLMQYAFGRIAELADRPGPFVFNRKGERQGPDVARKLLKKWRDRYHMPAVTFGSMRHSFATAAIKAGESVTNLSLWLGHCSPNVTQESYIKPSVEDLLEDVHKLGKIIDIRKKLAATADWQLQIVMPEPQAFESNDEYLDYVLALAS